MGKRKKKRMRKDTPGFREKIAAEIEANPSSAWLRREEMTPNDAFVSYYRKQPIVPPEEFERFIEVMKSPLPISFRVTGHGIFAQNLVDMLKSDFFSEMEKHDLSPPVPIPWYPGDLAWKAPFDKRMVKKHPALAAFHKFLVAENESGGISRQEEVSMIPPVFLDVQPHHAVLDLCAAPGSKTSQMIESIHSDDSFKSNGLVVANDVDKNRCYMLSHQMKRLNSPCFMVTSYQAQSFPIFYYPTGAPDERGQRLHFDRVLADVPCTGDGTMRKNCDIMTSWGPNAANGIHTVQLKIGVRGAQCLKPGGRMVYSTCSLNPVEDEAVVAAIIRACKDTKHKVKLVDVSHELPGLIRVPGLSSWYVTDKTGVWYESHAEAPAGGCVDVPSLFPPTPEEAAEMHLERCMRVLPHHQNSGGFFIAVLEKEKSVDVDEVEVDAEVEGEVEEEVEEVKGKEAAVTVTVKEGIDDDERVELEAKRKQLRDENQRKKFKAEGKESELKLKMFQSRAETPYILTFPSKTWPKNEQACNDRKYLQDHFGLLDTFPWHLISHRLDNLIRADELEKMDEKQVEEEKHRMFSDKFLLKRLYFLSEPMSKIMHRPGAAGRLTTTKRNEANIVFMGLRMFDVHKGKELRRWRASHEGISYLLPYCTRHVFYATPSDLQLMLRAEDHVVRVFELCEETQKVVRQMGQGSIIILFRAKELSKYAEEHKDDELVPYVKPAVPEGMPGIPEADTADVFRYDPATFSPEDVAVASWMSHMTVRLMVGVNVIKALKRALKLPEK